MDNHFCMSRVNLNAHEFANEDITYSVNTGAEKSRA